MNRVAVLIGGVLAIVPSIMYLADLRYRFDPALDRSVCKTLLCSDDLLLDTAGSLITGNKPDTPAALTYFREALRRNIASPDRWCDLAEALEKAGQVEQARHCFGRAMELGPQSPPVFWRAAQFYGRIHELPRSFEYMGKTLSFMPQYEDLVFSIYSASPMNIADTLEHGLPQNSGLAQDYFRYLLAHDPALDDTKTAWQWLENHSLTDCKLAGDYVEWLSNKQEYSLAANIWKRSGNPYDGTYLQPNFVFNGSFEMTPLQSGMDWRYSDVPGVHITRDSAVAISGSSSLQIDFDGTRNIDFHAITQNMIASPGRYHFTAWVRTSQLTTDQGLGFRLVDSSGQTKVETERLSGTHGWTRLDADFSLSGYMQPVRLEIVRERSWKFDNLISGRVWIDQVSVVRS